MSSRPSQGYRLRVKKVGKEKDPKAAGLTLLSPGFPLADSPVYGHQDRNFQDGLGDGLGPARY